MPLLAGQDYSDTDARLNEGLAAYKQDIANQTGEESVVTSELISFNGLPAIDFSLEGRAENYRTHGVYVVGNDVFFGIVYANKKELFNENDYERFVDSFRLEDVESRK